MKISKQQAVQLARQYLQDHNKTGLLILEDEAEDHEAGWLICPVTEAFAKSRDPIHSLLGGPILFVTRVDGRIHRLGPAGLLEMQLEALRSYDPDKPDDIPRLE